MAADPEPESADPDPLEAATDEAIAACGGSARDAVKALILANEYLESEVCELMQAVCRMLTCVEDSRPTQAERWPNPILRRASVHCAKKEPPGVFQAAQSRRLCQVQPPVVRSVAVVTARSYCDSTWLACHTVGCSQARGGLVPASVNKADQMKPGKQRRD